MSHITVHIDAATAERLRVISQVYDRPIEEICCISIAESAHAYFERQPDQDPARDMGQLHALFLAPVGVLS